MQRCFRLYKAWCIFITSCKTTTSAAPFNVIKRDDRLSAGQNVTNAKDTKCRRKTKGECGGVVCGVRITQKSRKINQNRRESANNFFIVSVCQYVAMQLVILTPIPTNMVFVYFSYFSSTLTICLFMSWGSLWYQCQLRVRGLVIILNGTQNQKLIPPLPHSRCGLPLVANQKLSISTGPAFSQKLKCVMRVWMCDMVLYCVWVCKNEDIFLVALGSWVCVYRNRGQLQWPFDAVSKIWVWNYTV